MRQREVRFNESIVRFRECVYEIGYFHQWVEADGVPVALIEKRDGTMAYVLWDRVKFTMSSREV
jgi:hypothetical protein